MHTRTSFRRISLNVARTCSPCLLFLTCSYCLAQDASLSWDGTVVEATTQPANGAVVELAAKGNIFRATSDTSGRFAFHGLYADTYQLSVVEHGHSISSTTPLVLSLHSPSAILSLSAAGRLTVTYTKRDANKSDTAKSGGEKLSSNAVTEIPLNKRDFSQLLLLAAGTATDTNGGANYTAQFAINGQRGAEATFAMDGADSSDPELGGATFTNFNVDAVQEIQSSSGWMPAEIGRGGAGYTNIVTRSGTDGVHGSVFEFLRNSALDARNYFDHSSPVNPGRIPPFRRNEFGFTNGGPVVLPHIYDGRGKTYYFGEYQGFRQVLGTTQVFPVPTVDERAGRDTTAYPGDTLIVPVDSGIAKVLARYPLPNYTQGAYGIHTYATSSNVVTNADQFSVRMDHQWGANHFFGRVSFDNLTGPTTNPDQTVLDPSFGVAYIDRQRNIAFDFSRAATKRLTLETMFSITRTTPSFVTTNQTDPAVKFNDSLFETFNVAGGSVIAAFNNLFALRQSFTYTTGQHAFRFGTEVRLNRDSTFFGTSPNGEYDFGGGTAYSRVEMASQSGAHTIHVGDPLPDTLSSFLSGSPFAYTRALAPPYFSNGEHIGPAAINRNQGAAWFQDTWKISGHFAVNYGLRYEFFTPITERARRTSSIRNTDSGIGQEFVVNPQPGYESSRYNWQPRIQLDWHPSAKTSVRAGGALTTIPPNIWQDNMLTGGTPFVIYPRVNSTSAAPLAYGFQIAPSQLPRVYTASGQDMFPGDKTTSVAPNTVMDVDRYEQDIATVLPDHQIVPLNVAGIDRHFGNAYLGTWTLGVERSVLGLTADASYVGTTAVHLARSAFPNGYSGADRNFARYTQFDSSGTIIGGFGTETLIEANSHSTYHALQTSLQGTIAHGGPGLQASYTWSKSLDDVSSVAGGFIAGASGPVALAAPQNPFNTRAEKGPSSFDVAHTFTLSVAQDLQLERAAMLHEISRTVTKGWELLSISSISSGVPFTVYSGIQQTGAGSDGVDRPDQIATPHLSTARAKREDYFGKGEQNASYFSTPIHLPDGTGPNSGQFGTLARNSFRGPAFYDFDFSLIKDTPLGRHSDGSELTVLQFRSEFFNIFNIVDMGLPANTIAGSGFGVISRTAGNSRQIQFSLKLLY
jgi:Carboxypeptidase regulatory-like domain